MYARDIAGLPQKPLGDRRIDLRYVLPEEITDPGLWDEYRLLLSPEESRHERRFARQAARTLFLVRRALMRTALACHTGVDPRAMEFQRDSHGKPSLKSPAASGAEFSLSSTSGLVVCAVSQGHAMGVDVEPKVRQVDPIGLARHYFASAEIAKVERTPPEERLGVFIELWTLKEAFVKASGAGLSVPLDAFAFSCPAGRPAEITFADRPQRASTDWWFARLELFSRHQIALAVQAPSCSGLTITVREAVPLRWQGPGRVLPESEDRRWTL